MSVRLTLFPLLFQAYCFGSPLPPAYLNTGGTFSPIVNALIFGLPSLPLLSPFSSSFFPSSLPLSPITYLAFFMYSCVWPFNVSCSSLLGLLSSTPFPPFLLAFWPTSPFLLNPFPCRGLLLPPNSSIPFFVVFYSHRLTSFPTTSDPLSTSSLFCYRAVELLFPRQNFFPRNPYPPLFFPKNGHYLFHPVFPFIFES